MTNYAGSKDPNLDSLIEEELTAAGIETAKMPNFYALRREVPTRVIGELHGWGFQRAWYYWVAEGPGIPSDVAMKLHETHGKEVRVAGHCGCPSPLEWYHGFAVGLYHVDTPEGLKALADAIKSVYVEASREE